MLLGIFIFLLSGFLFSFIVFPKRDFLERILLSILSSISLFSIIGMLLGFNEQTKKITGGLTYNNVLLASIFLVVILIVIIALKHIKLKEVSRICKNDNKKVLKNSQKKRILSKTKKKT